MQNSLDLEVLKDILFRKVLLSWNKIKIKTKLKRHLRVMDLQNAFASTKTSQQAFKSQQNWKVTDEKGQFREGP